MGAIAPTKLPELISAPAVLAALLSALSFVVAPPAQANHLFGVTTQGDLTPRDYDRMRAGGVATLRFGLWWFAVEPRPGAYDWSDVDAIMAGAASAGVEPRPFVYGTPSWLAPRSAEAPIGSVRARHAWQAFLRAAARRYGPGGRFWRGAVHPEPVREWQIWNEPNFRIYWRPQPSAPGYGTLLRLSDDALDAVDPRARVLLAGVAPVRGGVEPWQFLDALYAVSGVRSRFDAVALHPYSPNLSGIRYQLRLVRRVMAANGDGGKSLEITELGWASGGDRGHALVRTPRGQATILTRSFDYLRRTRKRWRLDGVSWYSWRDTAATVEPLCDFCPHSGLFTYGGNAKPAWAAYRSAAGPGVKGSPR